MSAPLIASMPADLDLPDGYTVTWAAIDPTTGADVSGVVVSNVSIFGTALGTGSELFLSTDEPILLGVGLGS